MPPSENLDILSRLEAWFKAECDGEWEHNYGINIETSDNPGWIIKIDLSETSLFGLGSAEKRCDVSEKDWINVKISELIFEGSCSAGKLLELIDEFLYFTENRKLRDSS